MSIGVFIGMALWNAYMTLDAEERKMLEGHCVSFDPNFDAKSNVRDLLLLHLMSKDGETKALLLVIAEAIGKASAEIGGTK